MRRVLVAGTGGVRASASTMTDMTTGLWYLLLDETGQVWVYRSLDEFVGSIESLDVADGICTAWASDGRRIELQVGDVHRYEVKARITTVDEQGRMRAALEQWVQVGLQLRGGPLPDTATWSTAALIAQAHQLQQPPPSLWQRLRRRHHRL